MYYIDKKYYQRYYHYMTYYSTVTSKGQMTLPADVRAKLNIKPGQRVAINVNNRGEAVIEPQVDLEALRRRTRAELAAQGITPQELHKRLDAYQNGDGFTAAVMEKYGQR